MKKIYFIIGIVALFAQCNSKPKLKETSIKIQVKLIDKLEANCFESLGDSYYFAYINLLNTTDSVFQFWTMTCSWQDNWVFEKDSIFLYYRSCPGNYPKLMQIKPGEKIVYKSIICIKNPSNSIVGRNLKLGLVVIKKEELIEDIYFYKVLKGKIKNKKDIMWSEPFKIDK